MRFRLQLWEMLGGEDVGQLSSTQDWRKWKDALLLLVDTRFGGSLLVAFICYLFVFVFRGVRSVWRPRHFQSELCTFSGMESGPVIAHAHTHAHICNLEVRSK